MKKKIVILNIASHKELIYTFEGLKITKAKVEELRQQYGEKLLFITKDISHLKVYDPNGVRSNPEQMLIETIEEDEDEVINEVMEELSL